MGRCECEAAVRRAGGTDTRGEDVTGDLSVDCDVVIVGSGAGGATTAAELAEAGVDVVVIEEGGYHPTESFTADSVRALRTLYRDGGGGMAVGRPSVLFAEGRCVGGSTVVNGGMSWPTPGRVLDRWAADGVLGISERDMEPYFARAEARHSVGLQDPETIGRDSELMRAGRRRPGLGRRPEPPRPAALRGDEQLQQRVPHGREALDAGDQRGPGAGAGRAGLRRLPGGPDHPGGARGLPG